ncbi:MAG TPA: hypothetical protein VGQ83_12395 [Polyangia bacterium]|jgi:hypothetical protein
MSRRTCGVAAAAAVAAAVGLAALAAGPAGGDEKLEIRLKVGEVHELRLGFIAVRIVCDDLAVTRVEDGGDHLRVVGLGPGRTQCGFWSDGKSPYPAKLYDIIVTPAVRDGGADAARSRRDGG